MIENLQSRKHPSEHEAREEELTPLRAALAIPSFNAGAHVLGVISRLKEALAHSDLSSTPILLIDDGSTDGSLSETPEGVEMIRHPDNRGKGAALMTALEWARSRDIQALVTLDADGQHPVGEAIRLLEHPADASVLLLAIRDLESAGAPRPNQLSNAFSNWVLSAFGGENLNDTQCGLRRYPVAETLDLKSGARGYALEADLVLRAARTGLPIEQIACDVLYPVGAARVSHFDSVKDPARIVRQVVLTTLTVPHHRPARRWGKRLLLGGVAVALLWQLLRT